MRHLLATSAVLGSLLVAANFFKSDDPGWVSRALNAVSWYGALLVAASLALVLIATVARPPEPR